MWTHLNPFLSLVFWKSMIGNHALKFLPLLLYSKIKFLIWLENQHYTRCESWKLVKNSGSILRDLGILAGFIICGCNINNYGWLTINSKKTKCWVVSKRKEPRCELKNADVKIEQVQKLKCPVSVLTDDGTYGAEIRSRIWKAKDFLN